MAPRTNSGALAKNLEKLSTGYKINRSADGAAELSISEKMRAQIAGLQGAQRNAKEGIGLIQTTEGALEEYHEILNRMLELSVKSANATYDDEVDREQLNKEMNRLAQELNRIADSTNFNGVFTLNGEDSSEVSEELTEEPTEETAAEMAAEMASLMDARLQEEGGQTGKIQITLCWDTDEDLDLHCHTPNGSHIYYGNRDAGGGHLDVDAQAGTKVEQPVENIYFDAPQEGSYRVVLHNYSSSTVDKASIRVKIGEKGRMYTVNLSSIQGGQSYEVTQFKYSEDPDQAELLGGVELGGGSTSGASGRAENNRDERRNERIKLLIGETADEYNILEVPRFDMHTDAVGLEDVNIATQGGAFKAIDKVKNAINIVSDARGTHGALQNRLEHTINYLGNAHENIQDAESVIRDTDMADEMMKYTKNQILRQSSQSMLAQANMFPEDALRLLQ